MKKFIEPIAIISLLIFVLLSPSSMFDNKAVFALLSPGEHTPYLDILYFLFFLLSRLAVIFLLPAYCLTRIFAFLTKMKDGQAS